MTESFYPASPVAVPETFTRPSLQYKKQVTYVLIAMALFMLLYLAMLAGSGFLVYTAISYPLESFSKITILLKLGAVAMSIMLFAFLLKSLFRHNDTSNPLNLEITEAEHPKLFAFIRQLCQETGAPFPHKVYVNHEINACVFYNSTILSLFLPVKKNLLIGLGLVNAVNLSEFKAVLAHEFGHFAQSSMKLGSYVYMANSIIHSMVYERDKWDELLEQWKNTDFRLAVFAWLLMPVVWTIRKSMNLIYQGINLVHASLSRQMEFNADRVAVSVTGSDAIVNALYKLGPASHAFDFSNTHLSAAADHKLYTRNLFFHHNKAVEHLSRHHSEFRESLFQNRLKHANQQGFLFTDEDEHLPQMYASHPSNFKREQNAKCQYIAAAADERSPWLLFDNPESLAEEVSINLLRTNLQLPASAHFSAPEEVHAFIEAELAETTYHEQYRGIYNERFLTNLDLGQVDQLIRNAGINHQTVRAALEELYGADLIAKTNELELRQKDLQTLGLLLQKLDKRKEFQLSDGKTYPISEAQGLYDQCVNAYETDSNWYLDWDRKVFATHYMLAAGQPQQQEALLERYRFHLEWQARYRQVLGMQQSLQETLSQLLERGNLSEEDVKFYADKFQRVYVQLENILSELDKLNMPSLSNMDRITSIRKHLLEEAVTHVYMNSLDGQQINKLLEQTALVIDRMRRIYFKSLGGILALQENLVNNSSVAVRV